MSTVEETSELKGGHPPAVKAGGMRITQHKPGSATHEKAADLKKDEGEEECEQVSTSPPKPHLMISGVVARILAQLNLISKHGLFVFQGDADFPAEAVQAYHNKPQASHEYRSGPAKPTIIHQPRK